MKKYLICMLLLPAAAFVIFYLIYMKGFYIDFHPEEPVKADFWTDGKELWTQEKAEGAKSFVIKGVDVFSSLPGHYSTEFAAGKEDYLRWLEQIGGMGANTVRVYDILDEDFYNAFYEYNTTHENPLYLLQGIQVSDAANRGAEDAYAEDFYGKLKGDGRDAVDVIHGNKAIRSEKTGEFYFYTEDLSEWVIGYMVGQEWDPYTISYTNHRDVNPASYRGTYFETASGSTAFEAMLAEIMDELTAYESKKYKKQRLISFVNDPQNDPFEYEESYAKQLAKINCMDAERVVPTDKLLSGCFASYRLYDFCDDFAEYLSQEQKACLGTLLEAVDKKGTYGGYLELLSGYHTMPVVAAGYGFSTARVPIAKGKSPLTEEEQGEALMAVWREASACGWSGMCISGWQDAWERRTWNTAFATVINRNYLWHDLQTDGQNYGILDFEPGKEEKVCYVDGDDAEWVEEEPVLEAEQGTLYAKQDAEGLYLLIRGKNLKDKPLYIPIDTTQESGSKVCKLPLAEFDREADFLLCVDGEERTRLLVQERYDALRENFGEEITGENPFFTFPQKNSPAFVTVSTALRNDTLIDESLMLDAAVIQKMKALGVWEAGKLVHGNGNPKHESYHSLADFCYGKDFVEICLPWGLLNVGDPSQMWIHRDYYEHYGVEYKMASHFYIGMGDGTSQIAMKKLETGGYMNAPDWHERLKRSYYVIQREWGEKDAV